MANIECRVRIQFSITESSTYELSKMITIKLSLCDQQLHCMSQSCQYLHAALVETCRLPKKFSLK